VELGVFKEKVIGSEDFKFEFCRDEEGFKFGFRRTLGGRTSQFWVSS